jgi:ABC-2 type transport system permease protein
MVTAMRDEEASGRLDNLLVRPLSRSRWLGARLLVATAAIIVLGVATGLLAWAGVALASGGVPGGRLVTAGLNLVPVPLAVLGLTALALASVPRAVVAVGYGLVAWSFIVELVGAAVRAPGLFLDLSLFHHVAPAPAADVNVVAAVVLVVLGSAAAAVALMAIGRRDVATA